MSIIFGIEGRRRNLGPALGVEQLPKISATPVVAPPLLPLLKLELPDQVDPIRGAALEPRSQDVLGDAETSPGEL